MGRRGASVGLEAVAEPVELGGRDPARAVVVERREEVVQGLALDVRHDRGEVQLAHERLERGARDLGAAAVVRAAALLARRHRRRLCAAALLARRRRRRRAASAVRPAVRVRERAERRRERARARAVEADGVRPERVRVLVVDDGEDEVEEEEVRERVEREEEERERARVPGGRDRTCCTFTGCAVGDAFRAGWARGRT